jgi:hypothetical protein
MKIAFLTEMGFVGKIPADHQNMRTEFAWMHALDADHFPIVNYNVVEGYDWVMLILPKGGIGLNNEGIRVSNEPNRFSQLYKLPFVQELKKKNKKAAYVQEGPTWYVNDFNMEDQFNFYNTLAECDLILAHNEYDTSWYSGLYPGKRVDVMPTLMIETLINKLVPKPENKAIIGGNFCRWYGGFQSYLAAQEFDVPIWVQTSHASQPGEEQVVNILPRMMWFDWIKTLSTFKYAIHMMPTVAAGTFSLNCAYLGIPCIGNENVDTQRLCFPHLSCHSENVEQARDYAKLLAKDPKFYEDCSSLAKLYYKKYFSKEVYLERLNRILSE